MRAFLPLPRAIVALCATGCAAAAASEVTETSGATRATVAYAVDGDTLRVRLSSGALAYVRLVGIDTPEDVRAGYPTECGAKAAAASMQRLAPRGSRRHPAPRLGRRPRRPLRPHPRPRLHRWPPARGRPTPSRLG